MWRQRCGGDSKGGGDGSALATAVATVAVATTASETVAVETVTVEARSGGISGSCAGMRHKRKSRYVQGGCETVESMPVWDASHVGGCK